MPTQASLRGYIMLNLVVVEAKFMNSLRSLLASLPIYDVHRLTYFNPSAFMFILHGLN